MRAFQVAMAVLSESEREEGETAFPALGTIISSMEEAREKWPLYSQGKTEIDTTPVFSGNNQKRLQG